MKKQSVLTFLIALLTSVLVFAAGSYLMGDFENKKIANVAMGDEYSVVAGVIRNEGNGWSLIQDNNHETIGIKEITQDQEKVIVSYNDKEKVNSIAVTVDETMAAEGYSVGASVGVSETWIFIYDKDGNKINPSDYENSTGNIWIQGIFKK